MKVTNHSPSAHPSFHGRFRALLTLLLLLGLSALGWHARALTRRAHIQQETALSDPFWQPLASADRRAQGVASDARAWRLNSVALRRLLDRAPLESQGDLTESQTILPLPLPDGSFARFRIEESPLLDAALAAQFPEIKSYRGQALDVPGLTMRGDWSPAGFHATLLDGGQVVSLFPAQQHDNTIYVSLAGTAEAGQFHCLMNETGRFTAEYWRALAPQVSVGNQLRTYRIAIAATWEYSNSFGGGTNAGTLASINTWLNGANVVYERELSVRLNLVSGTNVLFTTERGFNAGNDPFDNSNVLALKEQVRPVLRDQVGAGNYDLGHVLGGGTGFSNQGVAGLGVVCDNTQFNTQTGQSDQQGPIKGSAATIFGANYSVGDSNPLGVWIHELGHQFGAQHAYNGTSGICGGQRNGPTAYEPGSGTTIMSYPGICDTDNLASARDLRFHNGSFREILAYIDRAGGCGALSNKNNNVPTINGGADFTIPKQTPFTLTATGSDPDASDQANLTYAWEQVDTGGTGFANPPYGDQPADSPATTRPLFRSFAPTISPARTFPSLSYILNNANTPPATLPSGLPAPRHLLQTAEALPSVPRMLNFRVTIRDQRGGVNEDAVKLMVDGSGPMLVTAPNTAVNWTGDTSQTITWSVNGTNNLAANVRLLLSTDGGQSFPTVLLASTPNDGNQPITVPNGISTAQARLKLEAVGNIFFDISDTNFSIAPGLLCPVINSFTQAGLIGSTITLTGANFTGVTAVRFSNNLAAQFTVVSDTQLTAIVPAGAVSGPITLIKSGCNNTQTSGFTILTCTFSLSPVTQGFAATGGTGGVAVNASVASCGWTATSNANWLQLTAGANGTGNGTVNFTVAANTGPTRTGTLTIAGQPFTVTQLVTQPNLANVSAASFLAPELASESIAAAFGAGLATATQAAQTLPLPTVLAGTMVKVRDSAGAERAAPLFFVSARQVNYQIPPGTATGPALVTVNNNGTLIAGEMIVTPVAPGLFAANSNGRDVPAGVLVRVRGTAQQFEVLARFDQTVSRYVALPIDLGPVTDTVVAVLFGTGWRKRSALDKVEVKIGNALLPPSNATVDFAGAAPSFVGLDQLNFALPRELAGQGTVNVMLKVDGKVANTVTLNIK